MAIIQAISDVYIVISTTKFSDPSKDANQIFVVGNSWYKDIRQSISLGSVVTRPRIFSRLGKVLPSWANVLMMFFTAS